MRNTISNFDDLPLFLSVKETSNILRVSLTNTYDFVRSGAIPSFKIGKQFRIPRDSILEIYKSSINGAI